MDKDTAQQWLSKFEALPQCLRLHGYQPGFNPFEIHHQPTAVLNALNGLVLIAVRTDEGQSKGFMQKEKPEVWRIGLVTPVMGYKDTYGAMSTTATSLLSEPEIERLLAIWRLQGAGLQADTVAAALTADTEA